MTAGATAVTLPPIGPAPSGTLPIDPDGPSIACDQIFERLQKYNTMAREHDSSISLFLNDVTNRIADWYALLSPLEGGAQELPVGTFSVLESGGTEIANASNLAADNSALLAIEMDKILAAVGECVK